jgi:hypothetical protein
MGHEVGLAHHLRGSNHFDIIHKPHPEERALARVSKDGGTARTRSHPSRRAVKNGAPQDEVRGFEIPRCDMIGFAKSIH